MNVPGEMPTVGYLQCYICKQDERVVFGSADHDLWNAWDDAHKECEMEQAKQEYCSTHHVHGGCPQCEFDETRGEVA